MKVEGSCHCGEITFEAEADTEKVAMCNCTDCQQLSGSGFRVNVFIDEKDINFLTGKATEYVKTSQSGNKRAQAFCPTCGSAMYATSAGDGPRVYGVRITTLKQCNEFVPRHQSWVGSQLKWICDIDKIPGSEGN